jgi:hypothetical protein
MSLSNFFTASWPHLSSLLPRVLRSYHIYLSHYDINQLFWHYDDLDYLFAGDGGADFFVGLRRGFDLVFGCFGWNYHQAAELAVDLERNFDLVFGG